GPGWHLRGVLPADPRGRAELRVRVRGRAERTPPRGWPDRTGRAWRARPDHRGRAADERRHAAQTRGEAVFGRTALDAARISPHHAGVVARAAVRHGPRRGPGRGPPVAAQGLADQPV